jgi:2-phospho-L-lactate/phosphoenolpyruvate guanylyltransferase
VGYPGVPVRALALPVKSLDASKSRLAPMLSSLERATLTLAMLEDVLDATTAIAGWETWVVSPDEAVLELAMRRGARGLEEERPPLANAIRQVEEEASGRGAEVLGVLLADTPFVTAAAITRALHTLGPVVLAPSRNGGTNLLLRRPPSVLPARFGTDSYRKHLEAAATADIPTAVVESPELAFDLDLPGDILTVLDSRRRGRTHEVCAELDLRDRIAART